MATVSAAVVGLVLCAEAFCCSRVMSEAAFAMFSATRAARHELLVAASVADMFCASTGSKASGADCFSGSFMAICSTRISMSCSTPSIST